jgi:hypothetical protein
MSSRRVSLAVAVLAAAMASTFAVASADVSVPGVSAAVEPGPASVQLLECSRGKRASQRFALFRGRMSSIVEAEQMRMRFSLSEKIGASPRRGVTGVPSQWHYAKPGIERFSYRQRVVGLKPGTRYGVTVMFHWLGAKGEFVAERIVQSRTCRQRGKLPNLGVRDDIAVKQGPTPGTYRYVVKVQNNGFVPSPRTEVRLTVDGAEVDTRPIGRLLRRKRRKLEFVGPVCASTVSAQIDPADTVREITEQDNERTTACPPPK